MKNKIIAEKCNNINRTYHDSLLPVLMQEHKSRHDGNHHTPISTYTGGSQLRYDSGKVSKVYWQTEQSISRVIMRYNGANVSK